MSGRASGPVWVGQIELGRPDILQPVAGPLEARHRGARVLVRTRGRPLGFLTMAVTSPAALLADVLVAAEGLRGEPGRTDLFPGEPTSTDGRAKGGGVQGEDLAVSVVVCTRDRPDDLGHCMERLAALDYRQFEVVVVDNAPTDRRTKERFTADVGEDPRFRYAVEPVPGLSNARNRGLREALFPVAAFTDDDVLVDPGWLRGIGAGFRRSSTVGCVTGLVAPAELETEAQRFFDRHSGWPATPVSRLFDLRDHRDPAPQFPFSAGRFGTGANFAIDRALALSIGGFDPVLGAGTPTGGGEDLDMFVRVLFAGRALAYEATAIVWHMHRASGKELDRQLYSWGTGLAAYVTKQLLEKQTRGEVVRRILPSLAGIGREYWTATRTGHLADGGAPFGGRELLGLAAGVPIYLRSRARQRRQP
jgi:GT2 family glycosyltransferase